MCFSLFGKKKRASSFSSNSNDLTLKRIAQWNPADEQMGPEIQETRFSYENTVEPL